MATEYGLIKYNGDIQFTSKVQTEGYVKYPEDSGNVYFRKTLETGIEGEIVSLVVTKHKFFKGNPEIFQIGILGTDGVTYILDLISRDQDGSYSAMAESLIATLPNLKKGVVYKITPYNFTPEGRDRAVKGISFKVGAEKVEKLKQARVFKNGDKLEGEIPAEIWTFNEVKEKWNKDDDEKVLFLKKILDEATKTFERAPYTSKATSTAPKQETKVEQGTPPSTNSDKDELPF